MEIMIHNYMEKRQCFGGIQGKEDFGFYENR